MKENETFPLDTHESVKFQIPSPQLQEIPIIFVHRSISEV
jgi:hypothetical protein